ncbi:SusC/RagA family TonB-linked outer membrane protein [Arachidicoccus ginsenosidimutans]|nr:SusC/RagA family TonB-linked outer membrane protein [Arachidicoccus sp. BS20]
MLSAQTRPVSGKVTDETGKVLQGVTILIKGTKLWTLSDALGKFSIPNAPSAGTLHFSIVGYEEKDITVKAGTQTYNVVLKSISGNLNDVMVVGYGTVKKKDLTGAVGSVDMNDFHQAPVTSFDQGLAGRLAGVQVSNSDGQPGSNANIVIRGVSSITNSTSPLIVVDGFPLADGNLNSINPDDIESINVLKDASASALYGSRASAGVIIITTKRGKTGAPEITYDGYVGMQENPKEIPVMDAYNYLKMASELDSVNVAETYFTDGKTLDSYKNSPSLNFQKLVFRNALYQNHNLTLRGGSGGTKYSLSANALNQNGVVINSGFKRYQSRFTLDQNVGKNLKVGINTNYAYSEAHGAPLSAPGANSYTSNVLYGVWGYRPIAGPGIDLLSQANDPSLQFGNVYSDYITNPLIDLENSLNLTKNTAITANAYAEYSFIPALKLRVTGGYTHTLVEVDALYNANTSRGGLYSNSGPNGSIYYRSYTSLLNENTLTYNKTFNRKHHLNVLAGFTNQSTKTGNHGFSATQIPNADILAQGLDALANGPAGNVIATSTSSRWALVSYLARVNYDYNSTYLLTASYRRDGVSRFAPGQKWGNFPSVALAWRMINENFMKRIKFLSDAKLRLSWGETGNSNVSDFAYLSQITFPVANGYSYNNGTPSNGAIISALGNSALKWETTYQTDIGYDIGFLNQRISLTFDYYKKIIDNLLLNASLPYTTGVSNAFENIGKMQNSGEEFTLNTVNIQTKKFSWTSNFNISFNRNKVLALANGQKYMTTTIGWNTNYNNSAPYISVVGQPIGQMYGYIFDGIYQYSDFNKLPNGAYALKPDIPTNGNARANIKPGDEKIKDINGDGVVNAYDQTIIGNGLPKYVGGFGNNFTYAGFNLGVFLQWSVGNDILDANDLVFAGGSNNPYTNQYAVYENRWSPTNPSNVYARAGGTRVGYYTSNVIKDGSFLRVKTVSLGYSFSKAVLKHLHLKQLKIYVSAQNLFTITKYPGEDPEVSTHNSALTPGFDYSAYPNARTIVFGLSTTF